ncbi:MAG: hypothetical protein K9N48_04225 [Verrucomicrobia bacterium]|nr:hypothetical protein [Verrucomicrobiota bacterium]MCF7708636.1 hypothetical protein [Verrucomicrobiota bacterium]
MRVFHQNDKMRPCFLDNMAGRIFKDILYDSPGLPDTRLVPAATGMNGD